MNYHNSQLLIQWSLSLLRPLWRDVRNKQTKASSKPKKTKEEDHSARRVIIQIQVYFFSHYLEKKPRRIAHGQEDIGVLGQFCA